MNSKTRVGIMMAVVMMSPPLIDLVEARMSTHMLIQLPALFIAGGLVATSERLAKQSRWNIGGVPGLLAASLVLTFWMMPIALDRAVASDVWDAIKMVTVISAGGIAFASWQVAPSVVRAFFVGNLVWMGITIGVLYQSEDRRLCNAYLQDDQGLTGKVLVMASIVLGLAWVGQSIGRRSGDADETKRSDHLRDA